MLVRKRKGHEFIALNWVELDLVFLMKSRLELVLLLVRVLDVGALDCIVHQVRGHILKVGDVLVRLMLHLHCRRSFRLDLLRELFLNFPGWQFRDVEVALFVAVGVGVLLLLPQLGLQSLLGEVLAAWCHFFFAHRLLLLELISR